MRRVFLVPHLTRVAVLAAIGYAAASWPLVVAQQSERGDQGIRFSAPKSGAPSADPGSSSEERGRHFDFLQRGNSVSGVLEVPPSGGGGAGRLTNPRLLEQMDQKKNWIYLTDRSAETPFSPEKALGVREAGLWTRGGASQGVLADFMRQGRRTASTPPDTAVAENPVDPAMREPGRLEDMGLAGTTAGWGLNRSLLKGGSSGATDFGLGGIGGALAPVAGSPGSSLAPVGGGLQPFTSEFGRAPLSIRRLLATPDTVNPLAEGFDPINLRVDTTRQELNPTTPRRGPEIAADSKAKPLAPSTDEGIAGLPRMSLLETLNLKSLANPSLSPVITPPAPPPRSADGPVGFGEYPSRKF